MSTKYPEATLDLLAYQLTIKASQQYDGLYWCAYDIHYHVNAEASGNRKWAKLDTDFTTGFSQVEPECCRFAASVTAAPTQLYPVI